MKTRSPFLGDIPVWRKRLICNGVKVCPQLNPRAIWTHDKNALAILRTNLGQPHLDNPQHIQYEPSLADLTYTYYWSIHKSYYTNRKTMCNAQCGQLRTGKPVYYSSVALNGPQHSTTTYIRCSNSEHGSHGDHFQCSVRFDQQLNRVLLQELFSSGPSPDMPEIPCNTIRHTSARTSTCKFDHRKGSYKLINSEYRYGPCKAKFEWHVPHDTEKTPYALLIALEVHNHPPPPITRTPSDIREGLEELLKRADKLHETPGSVVSSVLMREYLAPY